MASRSSVFLFFEPFGRPRPLLGAAAAAAAPKRGRGRPKGSKNKKTLEREAMLAAQKQTAPTDEKGVEKD